MVTTTLHKAEDLLSLPDTLHRWELWGGVLRPMTLTGGRHGWVSMCLGGAIWSHVSACALGDVFSEGTAFVLERDPDTLYCPDVAFVARGRVPAGELDKSWLELAPDLVVEVLSSSNRPGEVRAKVATYLRLGVRAVWVVDADEHTVRIYTSDGRETLLSESDHLDGGEVIPGFRFPVAALFRARRP